MEADGKGSVWCSFSELCRVSMCVSGQEDTVATVVNGKALLLRMFLTQTTLPRGDCRCPIAHSPTYKGLAGKPVDFAAGDMPEPLERLQHPPARIPLAGKQSELRGPRKRMMVVVPTLAHRQESRGKARRCHLNGWPNATSGSARCAALPVKAADSTPGRPDCRGRSRS